MEISQNLKFLRRKSGLSQTELGQKVAVSRKTISAWENGRSAPGLDDLKNICELFDISSQQLIHDNSENLSEQIKVVNKKELQIKLKVPAFIEMILFIIISIGIPYTVVMNVLICLLLGLTFYLNSYSTKFLLPGERRIFYKKRRKFIIVYSVYLLILVTLACFTMIGYWNVSTSFALGLAYGAFGASLVMIFALMVIYNLCRLYYIYPVKKLKTLFKHKTQS